MERSVWAILPGKLPRPAERLADGVRNLEWIGREGRGEQQVASRLPAARDTELTLASFPRKRVRPESVKPSPGDVNSLCEAVVQKVILQRTYSLFTFKAPTSRDTENVICGSLTAVIFPGVAPPEGR